MSTKLMKRVLLSVAALGLAASIAGLGTYATFTSSTSADQTVSSGTVAITLGTAGTADNRLTIGATGLAPGDSLQRRVELTNATGNENLASIVLTTNATTSSVLDTDATNGLKMKIEKCAGLLGWRESLTTPYTYTCDQLAAADNLGSRTSVLAQRAIIGTDLALSSMSALTANNIDDMVVTVDLPSGAGNGFQTKTSVVQYTFTGTQRAATSK
jgi:predicted ribosomally synthesized peptide with SipW-like signal peptide